MSKQCYKSQNFNRSSAELIVVMNAIVDEYIQQNYRLTVRQLYYQLVSRDIVENTERSYKRVTSIVNDAKIAGLMDWEAIEDRTREFIRRSHWDTPSSILQSAARSFHMDMWETQDFRAFAIVEKEALAGVLERTCHALDVPLLAARGYPSGTVLREFCQSDILPFVQKEQRIVIFHLGDHDPSGLDMTRDLEDRIRMFSEYDGDIDLQRIALNMDQIEEQNPPPNPAKTTDSRFLEYRDKYGDESWELDALQPSYLNELLTGHINRYIDFDAWNLREQAIKSAKEKIEDLAARFDDEQEKG